MADEPKKKPDERKEKARSMYDSPRSKEMRGERDGDDKPKPEAEPEKKPTEAGDKTEGGEKRRKPGEAKPDDAMAGGHKAARVALAAKHVDERLRLHGDHRKEHREMDEAHEGELAALRHAA